MPINIPVVVAAAVIVGIGAYLLYAFGRGFVIEFRRLRNPSHQRRTDDYDRSDY